MDRTSGRYGHGKPGHNAEKWDEIWFGVTAIDIEVELP
jgi:hypothetical protein